MALTKIGTDGIKDDAVTSDKVANAINSSIAANTAKDLTALSANNITSGTVPDARISASSVTQHVTAFDDNNIINDISSLALKVNAVQNATRYNTNSTSVETFQDANAVIILTEWDEFKEINFEEAFEVMKKPAWIFDGRNVLDHQRLKSIGFEVKAVGKSI